MNKKVLLLPIIGSFLLTGCKLNLFGKVIYLFEQPPEKEQETIVIDDQETSEIHTHATSLDAATGSPNAPFFLKVGEVREIGVSLSPAPDLAEEKTISWDLDNKEAISFEVNETSSNKVTIEGKKAGNATLVATNDYNHALTYTFKIKVIEFDEENEYLWQYSKDDKSQFGYTSDNKAGESTGKATLSNATWDFERYITTGEKNTETGEYEYTEALGVSSINTSQSGCIGFGTNGKPETHVHLEYDFGRVVNSFFIEAASARGLAELTLTVGDTIVLDKTKIPDFRYGSTNLISVENIEPVSGKVQIDIRTPHYDYQAAGESGYKNPGAFYLKSLYLGFESETIASIKVAEDSQHKVDYFVGEELSLDGLSLKKVSERGYEFDVDVSTELENENLTFSVEGLDEASHEAKKVNLSLAVAGYETPFECSFDIHVRGLDWVPTSLEIDGEVPSQELVEGDLVDYSKLNIKAIYEEESDFITYPFTKNNGFAIKFGENEDPFVAIKKMESGYTIDVSRTFVSQDETNQAALDAHKEVDADVLNITEAIFDRIDFENSATLDALNIKSDAAARSGVVGKDNRLRFDFTNVSKEKGVGKVNKDFTITILDTELCFESIEFTFAKLSNSDNKFTLKGSRYGGGIYGTELATTVNQKLTYGEFDEHINHVLFAAGSNSYLGLVSCVIRYSEQSHIGFTLSAGDTAPTKMDYDEGEVFDPTGLTITLHEIDSDVTVNVTSLIKWYDGSSFNSAPQTTLLPESTYVVGVFGDVTINVNIGSVHALGISVVKVTSKDELTAGAKYYITCPDTQLILKGSSSNSDIFTGKGSEQYSDLEFEDSMNLNVLLKDDFVSITPLTNGNFTINTAKGFFSITASGNATCSNTSTNYREFSFEFSEDGVLTAEIFRNDGIDEETGEPKGPKFYLGCKTSTSTIKLFPDNYSNIVLYKVVD